MVRSGHICVAIIHRSVHSELSSLLVKKKKKFEKVLKQFGYTMK